jgi:hypothetical protein
MSVIYIHGIWNHPRLSVLKQRWDDALFPGPPDRRPQTRMARWSGVRYPEPVSDNEVIAGIQAAKQGFFPPGLPVWLDEAGRAWAEKLLRQIDGSVTTRWFRWFLAVFVQDAAAYFFRAGEREDRQVTNPHRRIWYRAGPHSETGYLRTAELREAVAP